MSKEKKRIKEKTYVESNRRDMNMTNKAENGISNTFGYSTKYSRRRRKRIVRRLTKKNLLVEIRCPPVLVLESRRFVPRLWHEEERPHWVEVEHGRLELRTLDGRDPHSPNITEMVVAALALHCGDLQRKKKKKRIKRKSFLLSFYV